MEFSPEFYKRRNSLLVDERSKTSLKSAELNFARNSTRCLAVVSKFLKQVWISKIVFILLKINWKSIQRCVVMVFWISAVPRSATVDLQFLFIFFYLQTEPICGASSLTHSAPRRGAAIFMGSIPQGIATIVAVKPVARFRTPAKISWTWTSHKK